MKRNNEFKEIITKNRTFYYFDDIINVNDLDLDNISFDEKSNENILIYHAANKLHTMSNLYALFLINQMGILGNMAKLNIKQYFILMKNMRVSLIKLDNLLR